MEKSLQLKPRDIHVDLIRTIALIAIVSVHAAGRHFITSQELNQFGSLGVASWVVVLIYQCFAVLGVPLFLMLSGMLLLQPDKNESLRVFFKKRFTRIGLPLMFWTGIYFVWDFLVVHYPFTISTIIQGILNGAYTQFWYIHVILGLYLLTPLMRVIIAHASRALIRYFVILWFISVSLLPFFALLSPFLPSKNIFIIAGYMGYFVLGIYLCSVQIRRRTALVSMLIGIALTALSTYLMMLYGPDQRMYFFQEYLSPTVIFTSIMAFLLLLSVKPPSSSQQIARPSILSRFFKIISENTLGVYFVHVIVIETIQLGLLGFMLNSEILNPILAVPLLLIITLFISLGIILLLKNIPGLKKIVT